MARSRLKKQDGPKLHYIVEWAEKRGMRQVDIVKALEGSRTPIDKSTVSRWFEGSLPERKHLLALQWVFKLEDLPALFRHPEDDWLARFFQQRTAEERYRARQMLEAAFPGRAA